jgi:hypothetical protein
LLLPAEQQLSTGFYFDSGAPASLLLLVKEAVFVEYCGDYPIGTERLRNDYPTATEGLPFPSLSFSFRIFLITSQTYTCEQAIPTMHGRL